MLFPFLPGDLATVGDERPPFARSKINRRPPFALGCWLVVVFVTFSHDPNLLLLGLGYAGVLFLKKSKSSTRAQICEFAVESMYQLCECWRLLSLDQSRTASVNPSNTHCKHTYIATIIHGCIRSRKQNNNCNQVSRWRGAADVHGTTNWNELKAINNQASGNSDALPFVCLHMSTSQPLISAACAAATFDQCNYLSIVSSWSRVCPP